MEHFPESLTTLDSVILHRDLFNVPMVDCARSVVIVVGIRMERQGWYEWPGRGPFVHKRPHNFPFGNSLIVVLTSPLLPSVHLMPRSMRVAIDSSVAEFLLGYFQKHPCAFKLDILPHLASEIQSVFHRQRPVTSSYIPILKCIRYDLLVRFMF